MSRPLRTFRADVAQEVVEEHVRLGTCRSAWCARECRLPGRPVLQHYHRGDKTVSQITFQQRNRDNGPQSSVACAYSVRTCTIAVFTRCVNRVKTPFNCPLHTRSVWQRAWQQKKKKKKNLLDGIYTTRVVHEPQLLHNTVIGMRALFVCSIFFCADNACSLIMLGSTKCACAYDLRVNHVLPSAYGVASRVTRE